MRYKIDTPEYEAYCTGHRAATDHELRNGPRPVMPKGYTRSQYDAWETGVRDGYQDT
jgi:hypothetical protein